MPTVRQNAVGTGAVMINKILSIRRIGWRVQPIRRWYEASKKSGGAEFENVLRGEMEIGEIRKPI